MRLPTRRLSSLLLLAATAACASSTPEPEGGETEGGKAASEQTTAQTGRSVFRDPQQPIAVAPQAEFDLLVEANPTTGYQWALADTAALGGVVSPVGSEFEPASRDPQVAGAGGHERWTFRAVAPGQATIALVYRRSWENTPPEDTTRFRVTVR